VSVRRVARAVGVGVLLALAAGCGPRLQSLPPGTKVPDVRGTWRGMWGKSQVLVTLTGDDLAYAPSSLNLGPIPIGSVITRDKEPTISGIIMFEVRGESVSTSVTGRIASFTGRTTLVLYASPADGDQELVLTTVLPDRMAGNGSSAFTWGPQGKVDLLREAGPPKPAAAPPAPRP
jgi:hypothetical protein